MRRHPPFGHGEHPKGYLQWLCFEPTAKSCTTYEERDGGVRALKALDWNHVLTPLQMPFLRALVADIADALGQPPSVGGFTEALQAPLTSRKHEADALPRNL